MIGAEQSAKDHAAQRAYLPIERGSPVALEPNWLALISTSQAKLEFQRWAKARRIPSA